MRIEIWSLYDQVRARELRSEPYLCIFLFFRFPRPEWLRVVRDSASQHIFGRPAGTSPGASLACLESANQHFHA